MDETKSRGYGSWILIATAMLLFGIAIATTQYKVPVIMSNLMEQFGMDAASSSWLMSIFTFVGIVLALPTGLLAKKFGPKNMLVAAAAVMAAGSVFGAFVTDGTMLIVSRGIEGVAFIFVTICGPLTVQKYVAPDKIGSATGIWALWVCLGSVVGGTLTPSLFSATGFMGVWIIYALCVVIFAIGVVMFVRFPGGKSNGGQATDVKDDAPKASYAELLKPNMLLYLAGFLAFNMVLMAVLSFGPTWMQRQGIDPTMSGFLSTLPMLLAVVSSPLFGRLIDKFGRCKPLYLIAMVSMGPCAYLMLTGTGEMLWAGAILMGLLGLGCPVVVLTALNAVIGKPELASIGMGVLMLVQSLGMFLGTFVSPMLLGPGNDQWMVLGVFMFVAGLVGTGFVALCKFK